MSRNLWGLTLKIAWRVRRCRSVKTRRGFFGAGGASGGLGNSSFLLQAKIKKENYTTSAHDDLIWNIFFLAKQQLELEKMCGLILYTEILHCRGYWSCWKVHILKVIGSFHSRLQLIAFCEWIVSSTMIHWLPVTKFTCSK